MAHNPISLYECHCISIMSVKCSRYREEEGTFISALLSQEHTIEVMNYLDQCYFDVLCTNCVGEIKDKFEAISTLDEFYMDGNLLVFTETYHLSRGYCCRSRCRHCPYGYG
jgi:Family of unknown function (DUF5522)